MPTTFQSLRIPGAFISDRFVFAVWQTDPTLGPHRQFRVFRADDGSPSPLGADVSHALGVERIARWGGSTLELAARGVWDLNRNFRTDRFNLNLTAGASRSW